MDEVAPESYECFNDFFCIRLKKDARIIVDERAIISHADCRVVAFEDVNESTAFWNKGKCFCVNELLNGQEKDLKKRNKIIDIFCMLNVRNEEEEIEQEFKDFGVGCDSVEVNFIQKNKKKNLQ